MREVNYDEALVPPYTLPDPLRFADGSPVDSPAAWWTQRRPEILRLFEDHVYGRTPPDPATLAAAVVEEDGAALDGRAVRRQVRIRVAVEERARELDMLLYLPRGAGPQRPAPVFLGLNFGGNHTVAADPAIRLPSSWVRGEPGSAAGTTHRAADADRGRAADAWCVEMLLARGYGLATLHYGDIEPDRPDGFADGVRALFSPAGPPDSASAWGAIGAWAWGLRRALDVLEQDPAVDAGRVALVGHSRLGKTALWAGAQDPRFALVISNNSGCGGAALSRRIYGESVARINTAFPHWFCPAFRRYNDNESELPVDQHMLLALIAPRPLYVASAVEDRWADPRGEFLAAVGADPVYRLLGREGLGLRELPPLDRPVGSAIGYHLRAGGHGVTPGDWRRFLDFADRQMGAGRGV